MRIKERAQGNEVGPHRLDQVRSRYHRATHDVAVPGGIFGQAVHEDIDIVLAVVMKAGKRVIEQRQRPVCARRPCQTRDIGDLGDRIGRAFEHDQAGWLLRQRLLGTVEILDRQQRVG